MSSTLGPSIPQIIHRGAAAALAATLFITLGAIHPAFAQTETILYDFCTSTGCPNGGYPPAGPVMDSAGNFYGTTADGGAFNDGAIYKVTPDGSETVLYSFGAKKHDGEEPLAGLLMDREGNLYGTTAFGGENDAGAVFRVTPAGLEKVLYSFCSVAGCVDGNTPYSTLIMDKEGNLYGTTNAGGANRLGTVFKLTPGGTETVLHSFAGGRTDGSNPYAGLVMDPKGNLYGVTSAGGNSEFCEGSGCGTVFEITSAGAEGVLYSFCPRATTTCTDGSFPRGTLLRASDGTFYGTTSNGGTSILCGGGCGTAFKLSGRTETILHSFGAGSTDGIFPLGGLIMDSGGNLYGATNDGGSSGQYGTVYEISTTGTETILHNFIDNGVDGLYPQGSLILDSSGNLYGATSAGGTGSFITNNGGVLYEITP